LALAAGLLRAADSPEFLYRFRLPNRATKVEWTSTGAANWDVTVTVDAKCRLTCSYRVKRGSPAARLLARRSWWCGCTPTTYLCRTN